MKTRTLGTSDATVSALCLGTMHFGSRNDQTISYQLLDQYVDAGGSFLDTANIYARWVDGCAGGESESLLGDWMRERGNRDKLFIGSKVGFEYPGVERGLQAAQIEEECNKSLQRMGIDTIDLFYAHVDDRNTPQEETLEAFDKLVKAGKVRYIGASNFRAWRLEQARELSRDHDRAAYCCIQQRYTYLYPRAGADFSPQLAVNDDLLDYARSTGVSILAYSALLSGAYSRNDRPMDDRYISQANETRFLVLKEIMAETGASINQVVLAWMMHHDPPVIPLIAASTSEQMAENIAALELELTADQMQRLDTAG